MTEMNLGFIELSARQIREVLGMKDFIITGLEWIPEYNKARISGFSTKFRYEVPEGTSSYMYPIKEEKITLLRLGDEY